MIKRIYYYFELKELLEKKELMPFVEWRLKRKYGGITLFKFCITNEPIRDWFDLIVHQQNILHIAMIFVDNQPLANVIKKHFNQARDMWIKTHKNI